MQFIYCISQLLYWTLLKLLTCCLWGRRLADAAVCPGDQLACPRGHWHGHTRVCHQMSETHGHSYDMSWYQQFKPQLLDYQAESLCTKALFYVWSRIANSNKNKGRQWVIRKSTICNVSLSLWVRVWGSDVCHITFKPIFKLQNILDHC